MFCSHSDEDSRRLFADYSVWSLRRLSAHEASVLDCPAIGGIVRQYVRDACYTDIQQREFAGGAALPGRSSLYETLSSTFPREDPVFLCWRVRYEDWTATLARADVFELYAPGSSENYRRMVERFYSCLRREIILEGHTLCNKILDEGRCINRSDVETARYRIKRVIEARKTSGPVKF